MKNKTEWKVYRTPFLRRLKFTPLYFYFQYKHWREDGCDRLTALHHAYWFTKFYFL